VVAVAAVHLEALLTLLVQAVEQAVWFIQLEQVSVDLKQSLLALAVQLELAILELQPQEAIQLLLD
jgi:hypothetical protein